MAKRKAHYCVRIGKEICEQIALGKTLTKALEIAGPLAPNKATFWRWLEEFPAFGEQYERARAMQADAHADRMLELADDVLERPNRAAAIKVASDIIKWQAEIRNPRTYGSKVQHELKAPPMSPEQLKKEIAALEAELGVKAQPGMDTAKRHDTQPKATEPEVADPTFVPDGVPIDVPDSGWVQ